MAELAALPLPRELSLERFRHAFGLESGPQQLDAFFDDVRVARFDNSLAIPSAEPVLAYIRSSSNHRDGDDLSAARDAVETEIRRAGVFHVSTRPGVISCTNRERPGGNERRRQ